MTTADPQYPPAGAPNRPVLTYRLDEVLAAAWLEPAMTPNQRAQQPLVQAGHPYQQPSRDAHKLSKKHLQPTTNHIHIVIAS